MRHLSCSLCVHLYVTGGQESPTRRCLRCRRRLTPVHPETLAHLRQVWRRPQVPSFPAARDRFRATVRARLGTPWISVVAMETLSTALINAVDLAARGNRDAGYVCLIDGLQTAEAGAAAGVLWGAALTRCYHEVMDVFTVRYDLCRDAEEMHDGPRLLAELALVEFEDEVEDASWIS